MFKEEKGWGPNRNRICDGPYDFSIVATSRAGGKKVDYSVRLVEEQKRGGREGSFTNEQGAPIISKYYSSVSPFIFPSPYIARGESCKQSGLT